MGQNARSKLKHHTETVPALRYFGSRISQTAPGGKESPGRSWRPAPCCGKPRERAGWRFFFVSVTISMLLELLYAIAGGNHVLTPDTCGGVTSFEGIVVPIVNELKAEGLVTVGRVLRKSGQHKIAGFSDVCLTRKAVVLLKRREVPG